MSTIFENNPSLLNLPIKTPTFMIAVPKCHDNLFQIIKDNHEWLAETKSFKMNDKDEITYGKKINNKQDLDRLERIIKALRMEKSELFIDDSYHAKPYEMKMEEYIREFIKNKSVGTHYTFRSFYRITVLPDGTNIRPTSFEDNKLWEQRREYLIIPLYIIMKRGKTYDQMKMLSYNPDGSYTVNKVNPYHFYKVDNEEEVIEKEQEQIGSEEERKDRYDELLTSS